VRCRMLVSGSGRACTGSGSYHQPPKKVAETRIIPTVKRPPLLSVADVAAALGASQAYVRRLLASQRLFGVKVGRVWAVYPADLASFRRMRRPPGRPRRSSDQRGDEREIRQRIDDERRTAGTDGRRLKPRRG
jgi:excisionase family DNA binding protein